MGLHPEDQARAALAEDVSEPLDYFLHTGPNLRIRKHFNRGRPIVSPPNVVSYPPGQPDDICVKDLLWWT